MDGLQNGTHTENIPVYHQAFNLHNLLCCVVLQGIKQHPWYTAPLNDKLEQALSEMSQEQAARDSMTKAMVSTVVGRHDVANAMTGEYATIDTLVKLAQKSRCGGLPTTVCDNAHL